MLFRRQTLEGIARGEIERGDGGRTGNAGGKTAAQAGAEKLTFKQDVRKLKKLGLTESGYRLLRRGRVVIGRSGELGL